MITNKKPDNYYDDIKGLLNKVRKIQAIGAANKGQQLIKEQETNDIETEPSVRNDYPIAEKPIVSAEKSKKESKDVAVINNVDIEIHSEDPEDIVLTDEEKKKISQLIDDFRTEISEVAELDALHIYPNSAVLNGLIPDMELNFTFSTGDDTGLYIGSHSLLKIEDESLNMINKLKVFQVKFSNTINDLLLNRSTT
jgi:sporulation protein YlmC with PRC-barrel domain